MKQLEQISKTNAFYNRSLERALQILCAFNAESHSFKLGELAHILDLPKATVSRLCSTLIKYDFLKYDLQLKQYGLGLKLFQLGSIIYASLSLRKAASSHLTRLQSKLGKTVFLGILQEDELVYIDKKENPRNPILFGSQIGTRRPPHFGMLGQVLMAHLKDNEVEKLLQKHPLKKFTKRSIANHEVFKKRLQKIREQGFHLDREEALDGITGVAAPIRDYTHRVIGAVGVGFISSSEDSKGVEKIIKEAVRTAKAISQDLGYFDRKISRV
jgi:DNA-binding IclR family transcriptional regulator